MNDVICELHLEQESITKIKFLNSIDPTKLCVVDLVLYLPTSQDSVNPPGIEVTPASVPLNRLIPQKMFIYHILWITYYIDKWAYILDF